MQDLRERTQQIIQLGKKLIDHYQLGQFQFSAEDEIRAAETMVETGPVTASFVLSKTVMFLTELFFDIRQDWIPAPKQRALKINDKKLELYGALEKFYRGNESLQHRMNFAKEIIKIVFENNAPSFTFCTFW